MASPRIIRQALGARLSSISGLRVYERWPNAGALNMPCAILIPANTQPEQTFGRGDLTRYHINVHVYVTGAPGNDVAQDRLDPFLATSSTGGVFGAIAADRTLGGAVGWTFVQDVTGYDEYGEGDITLWGAIVGVECWAT